RALLPGRRRRRHALARADGDPRAAHRSLAAGLAERLPAGAREAASARTGSPGPRSQPLTGRFGRRAILEGPVPPQGGPYDAFAPPRVPASRPGRRARRAAERATRRRGTDVLARRRDDLTGARAGAVQHAPGRPG